MIILRLIFISKQPSPDENISKTLSETNNLDQRKVKEQKEKKKNNIKNL